MAEQTEDVGFEGKETEITTHLTGKGYLVVKADEYTAVKTSEYNTLKASAESVQSEVNKATKSLWDAQDAAIKESTGIEKLENEKTTDYAKRAVKALKDSKGSDDPVVKGQIKELQDQLKTLKEKDEANERTIAQAKISKVLGDQISGLNLVVSKEDAQALVSARFEPTLKDGKVFYKDAQGDLMVNADQSPKTAKEIIETHFKSLIKPGKPENGGTGSGEDAPDDVVNDKKDFKGATREEIITKLRHEGLSAGTPAYKEAYTKALAAAGIK